LYINNHHLETTEMSNELVPFKVNLPAVTEEQLETLDEVAKGADFLPRIQLITKGKYVDTGKITPGHWGIPQPGGDEIEDLGPTIDVIPFTCRAKALDVSDREAIITNYNFEDEAFQRIKKAPKNTGCMWGPSFLVLERSTGILFEMFFSNKSGRAEAGKLRKFLPTKENGSNPAAASLGIRYVDPPATDYGWHVPVITKCSEPFDQSKMKVTSEQVAEEVQKFLNPEAGVEKVPEEETKKRKRAQ
jgi:hypothetical protein